MKIKCHFFLLLLVSFTACSAVKPKGDVSADPDHFPETVLVTYHVKTGKESDLEGVLHREWKVYRENHLVFAQPHVIIRDTESGNKTRVSEIFTWVSHAAPDHAPDSVKTIWNEMQALCEARDNHSELEFGEVEIWEPRPH